MSYKSRKVTTFFTAADESEPDITVEVTQLNRFDVEVTGLDDVPESELAGVIERATELYWAAERRAYLLSSPDAE